MAQADDVTPNGCVEIMAQIGIESDTFPEQEKEGNFVSFDKQFVVKEEPSTNEHSYAYSDRKQAFENKEKDHSYFSRDCDLSKTNKTGVQKEHSYSSYRDPDQGLSDDDISDSKEELLFTEDPYYYQLPHHKSSDSALDVTGFDSISEKCLSTENLNVQTVDVFTDSILHGKSDPDLSRMTLQSNTTLDDSIWILTRSGPVKSLGKERMKIDHNYSAHDNSRLHHNYSAHDNSRLHHNYSAHDNSGLHINYFWSPLHDHSYDLSGKSKSDRKIPIQRKRSEQMLYHPPLSGTKNPAVRFPKSPFVDHTYQSLSYIVDENNRRWPVIVTKHKERVGDDKTCDVSGSEDKRTIKSGNNSKVVILDHTYEKRPESYNSAFGVRCRSNSLSDFRLSGNDSSSNDKMEDNSSDSGTESLNGMDETPMLTDHNQDKPHNDHSYFDDKKSEV